MGGKLLNVDHIAEPYKVATSPECIAISKVADMLHRLRCETMCVASSPLLVGIET